MPGAVAVWLLPRAEEAPSVVRFATMVTVASHRTCAALGLQLFPTSKCPVMRSTRWSLRSQTSLARMSTSPLPSLKQTTRRRSRPRSLRQSTRSLRLMKPSRPWRLLLLLLARLVSELAINSERRPSAPSKRPAMTGAKSVRHSGRVRLRFLKRLRRPPLRPRRPLVRTVRSSVVSSARSRPVTLMTQSRRHTKTASRCGGGRPVLRSSLRRTNMLLAVRRSASWASSTRSPRPTSARRSASFSAA
mmetsp:Transcript_16409/g.38592  ORF Transcript_16409/g.38592 Transcript_16409/m.38592 type:complete len:246 (+) Transcript_16409:247-984(+)